MAERANKLANRLVKIVINFPVIKPVSMNEIRRIPPTEIIDDFYGERLSSSQFAVAVRKNKFRLNLVKPWLRNAEGTIHGTDANILMFAAIKIPKD